MVLKENIIRAAKSEIELKDNGILYLRVLEEYTELDIDDVKECFEVYDRLGIRDNQVLQVIDVSAHFSMSKEGREYVAKIGHHYFKASALVSNSVAMRLVVNFFNAINKPKVPFKIFGTEEAALKWLEKYRN
jgi:hypothetical protein